MKLNKLLIITINVTIIILVLFLEMAIRLEKNNFWW